MLHVTCETLLSKATYILNTVSNPRSNLGWSVLPRDTTTFWLQWGLNLCPPDPNTNAQPTAPHASLCWYAVRFDSHTNKDKHGNLSHENLIIVINIINIRIIAADQEYYSVLKLESCSGRNFLCSFQMFPHYSRSGYFLCGPYLKALAKNNQCFTVI